MKHMLAGALTLAVTTLTGAFTLIPSAHASPAAAVTRPVPAATADPRLAVTRALPVLPLWHVVQAGDTLSGLAVRYCAGHDKDWTGFYHDNAQVIGANPNLIFPGQRLHLTRCADPPALLHLGSTYHAHRAVYRGGKTWGVTYGYPDYCGDGDRDGWDVHCGAAAPARHAVQRSYSSGSTVSYGNRYSYAGLEALWVSAGGPGWAAAHAAEIAMCESGGNVYAYNPSGATGLWQILGSVVPGNLYNPYVNALNAVAKFRASGDTFAQWVCT